MTISTEQHPVIKSVDALVEDDVRNVTADLQPYGYFVRAGVRLADSVEWKGVIATNKAADETLKELIESLERDYHFSSAGVIEVGEHIVEKPKEPLKVFVNPTNNAKYACGKIIDGRPKFGLGIYRRIDK